MPPSTSIPSAVVLVVAQRLNRPASQYSQPSQPKIASIATARPSSVTPASSWPWMNVLPYWM